MRAGLLLVVLSLFFCNSSSAQITNEADFKKKFGLVDGYLYDGDYHKALPLAKELYAYDTSNANVAYMLGTSYLGTDPDRKKAIHYLEQALMFSTPTPMYKEGDYKEKSAPGVAFYNLARAYHFVYRFDDAISNYYNYRSFVDLNDAKEYAQVKRQIEYSENAKLLIEEPVKIKIQSLGPVINSKFEDYSPVISADGNTLIFTSRRQGSTGGKLFSDGKYYEDIYISKKERGKWTTPRSIGANINTEGHEATIGLSPDGQELFIYKDDNGDGNIYMSKLNGAEWSKPEKLGGDINTTAWETHATVSADGQNLFFVSNRKGGIGGRDIYKVSKLPSGVWGTAENLGKTINTPYDEEAPFFAADGKTLIFSSQGHNSMGGFDIFTSENIDGVWSTPVNIGYPINSPEDDVFFVTTPDGHFAYYSSRMEGGMGEKDIYLIELTEKKKESLTVMKGVVILENSPEIIANIIVADARTNAVTGIYKPNKSTGSYIFILQPGAEYNVTYECDGYQTKADKIVVPANSSYAEITKAIILDPVICGKPVAQNEEKKVEEVAQIVETKQAENEKLAELKALEEQLAAMEKSTKEEEVRLAEEKRKAEAAAKAAEEKRLAEEATLRAKLEEEKRKAEVAKAEEARIAEEKKKQDELAQAKSAEEKKLAEESAAKAKAEEAARLAEEKRKAEDAAKAKAEQERLAAEKKKSEELAAAKATEEKKLAEEAAAKAQEVARLAEEKKKSEELAAAKAAEEKKLAAEAAAKAKAEEAARLAEEKKKSEELAAAKAAEEKKLAAEAAAKAKAEEAARLAEEKKKAEELAAAKAAEEKKRTEELAAAKAEQEKKLAEENARLAEEKRKVDEAAKAKAAEEAKLLAEKKKQEEQEKILADQKKKAFEDSLLHRKNEIIKRLEELKKLQAQKSSEAEEDAKAQLAKEAAEKQKQQQKAQEEAIIAERKRAEEEAANKAKQEEARKQAEKAAEEKRKAEEAAAKLKAEEEARKQQELMAEARSLEELKKMNQALILENEQLKKQIAESNKKIDHLTNQVEQQNRDYRELLTKFEELQKQQKLQKALEKTTDFASFTEGKAVVLKNIFFDYNLSIIRKESENELNRLYNYMKENKDIKVEVSGHTDSHGNDEYNNQLSKDRANEVVRYLTRKGIEAHRFKAVGMGEKQPIAINENPDGSDNPEGRQLNRRIEIRILNPEVRDVKIENIEVPKDLKPKS